MKRTISFTLRMPEDLHAQLDRAAQDSHHSMNALALDAIRSSLQPRPQTTVAEDVRQALQLDFSKLEERILAHLRPLSEVTAPGPGMQEIDLRKAKTIFSDTVRLSDAPAIAGLTWLPRREHIDPPAAPLGDYEQFSGRIKRQPLAGQVWVITGSLETMTRDRAREILTELGATVAGTVSANTNGLIWGPGAGSKLDKARTLGVQLWNERQFIHMIQGMGVDMPLPKTPAEQHLVTPGALEWDVPVSPERSPGWGWTINTGVMPEAAKGKRVDLQHFDGRFSRGEPANDFDWALDGADSDIAFWRLSSIELQPQVQPRTPK